LARKRELYKGRSKKIIAAAYLNFFNTDFTKRFNCKICDKEDKKVLGCVRAVRSSPAKFRCFFCDGENKKCIYCKGTNEITLNRCPRAIADRESLIFIPHFFRYLNNYQYPDGKAAIKQPKKLLLLFDIWGSIYKELKEQEEKKK
jgi:hypothetical protein